MDSRRHFALSASRYVDADMAAFEGELGVIGGADVLAQRSGGIRRHQMILRGVDIEDGLGNHPEVHRLPADLQIALDQFVLLEVRMNFHLQCNEWLSD